MNTYSKGDYVKLHEKAKSNHLEHGRVYRVVGYKALNGSLEVLPSSPRDSEEATQPIITFEHRLEPASTKEIRADFTPPKPKPSEHCVDVKPKEMPDNGLIDKQEHYTSNGIQPIDIMKANLSTEEFHGWLVSNVWKYTMRYKRKNGIEDIKKAMTYLTWLKEDIEKVGDDIYWKK